MLKRSLVFMHPATLSLRNGQMVIIRKELPDDNLTVPIEDIGLVMINHAMVSLTIPPSKCFNRAKRSGHLLQ